MARQVPIRYSIVALALAINMLCYTDRVCIAVAGPKIRGEFGFSAGQMGLVFSIFSLAYAAGQTPWGMLADRWGARGIITAAIFSWSVFTALTGAACGFLSMLAIRFTFGALEAALSPSIAAAFTRWVPLSERSTSFGAYLSGGRLGAALTPPLAVFLMLRLGWRLMFAFFGALGVAAAAAWFLWYRDQPASHPRIGPEERAWIRAGTGRPAEAAAAQEASRWSELLRSSRLWCLLGVAFASTFLWQFYITWFPTYLIEKRGLPLTEAAFFAGLPFLFGVAATWVGGLAADFLTRRFDARRGRLFLGCTGLLLTGTLMALGVFWPAARVGAALMALAAGTADLYLGAAWSAAVDIGGCSGGAVSGLMNAASNFAGFASPALMGWVLQTSNNWNAVLWAGIATTFAGVFLWMRVNAPQPEAELARAGEGALRDARPG
ncbi:MAG TPA: MFS transporter [Bryobacteraceae bacterium]|nr:MFS transporter [Bryobacteraceae bacterium]